jgi:hypothetical protein
LINYYVASQLGNKAFYPSTTQMKQKMLLE